MSTALLGIKTSARVSHATPASSITLKPPLAELAAQTTWSTMALAACATQLLTSTHSSTYAGHAQPSIRTARHVSSTLPTTKATALNALQGLHLQHPRIPTAMYVAMALLASLSNAKTAIQLQAMDVARAAKWKLAGPAIQL